jgi:hypothetical protein
MYRIGLIALALACLAPVPALAQGVGITNNPTSTYLEVRASAGDGDGWTTVTASNQATYSCRYTGGNRANDGSVGYAVGGGKAAITVNLDGDGKRYAIEGDITFVNDPDGQLTTEGQAPRTRVINNSCTGPLDAQYKVLVRDTHHDATIQCDPPIINK